MQTLGYLLIASLLWVAGEARRCYHCLDCEKPSTVTYNADCSLISNTTACYIHQTISTGSTVKACGLSEIDKIHTHDGCRFGFDAVVCRCSTDLCNQDSLLKDTIPPANQPSTSAVGPTTTKTTTDSWPCYVCADCGQTTGQIRDCSFLSASSCYLLKRPNGKVFRACGSRRLEKIELSDGCYSTYDGYTICKCSQKYCNAYPHITDEASPSSTTQAANKPATTVPDNEEFFCHSCINCGDSVGPLVKCSKAKSCALIIQNGNVSRECGTAAVEVLVPEARGCHSSEGYEVCKCSTTECNSFYRKTGISPFLEDEYNENVILVASAMKQDKNIATTQSSSASRPLVWSECLIIFYLLLLSVRFRLFSIP